jgi:dipeptidyl aminopeptidase/acylaminoacyl peptidase
MTLYQPPRVWKKRLVRGVVVLLIGYVILIAYFSHFMVSPPRVRVSDSERPVLGLQIAVDRDITDPPGVRILAAFSPSREAGLRAGDRIIRVNDRPVDTMADLEEEIVAGNEGDRIRIQARRKDTGGDTAILVDVPLAVRPVSPSDHGLAYRDVAFTDPRGRTLRGWYIPAPPGGAGPSPGVVYGHGNGGDRRHMLTVATAVHRAGIAQLFIDFAGRGESEGSTISLGAHEAGAMIAGLDFLSALQEVDGRRLALAGRSMGAVAAALAAGRDSRVKALVLDSPFTDLSSELDHAIGAYHLPPILFREPLLAVAAIRARFDPSEVTPLKALESYRGPILLFHGSNDEVVPASHAREYKDSAGPRLELHLLEGEGHNGRRPAPYAERIADFIRRGTRG